MKRRDCLTLFGTGAVAAVSGCLGEPEDRIPEVAVERDDPGGDECIEQELLDHERVSLAPRLVGLAGFNRAVQWELDLQEGEELYLRITGPDMHHLPHLEIVDPQGVAIIDERPVDNIYTVQPDVDGRYLITVSNQRWGEGGVWFVDMSWYNSPGCRR